ncbi:F-box protein of unknown function [Saguinus oedipus]|uniref:S-phase kinase-associated protein 2 n=1 Tax=Saguinus oedipus TaxID=9490 RepID=A0ABQ9W8P1_SAGOE|nr:F-box protein of unknown function [Saguinus oedipus]
MHRKHLQEIPDLSSNVATSFTWGWDSSKTSELLSGMGVSALEKEEPDSENIPQELLSNLGIPQSPPRKRLKSKGSDKDFVIIRRPKLNRENFPDTSCLNEQIFINLSSADSLRHKMNYLHCKDGMRRRRSNKALFPENIRKHESCHIEEPPHNFQLPPQEHHNILVIIERHLRGWDLLCTTVHVPASDWPARTEGKKNRKTIVRLLARGDIKHEIQDNQSSADLMPVSADLGGQNGFLFDESLWQTLDLTGKNLHPDVTGRLLSQGVIAFRCPRSFMDQPLAEHFSPFRVQHMDLSNSVIEVSTLQGILSQCSKLQNLSLEGLRLSDPIVNNLAQNSNLVRLNLCGCSGFSEFALQTLLSGCSRLDELNLSWCFDFTEKHVQVAVAHVSETITQLNLSGYRKNLQKSG